MAVVRGLFGASAGALLAAAIPVVAQAQTQTGTVTGQVVDSASRQPLPNVTVSIPGTTRGALTGPDGRFTIGAVPAGTQTVRAARIGYAARTQQVAVPAGGSVAANFVITAQIASLSEVVVQVGYGQQAKESITGSVAQVKAEDANVGVIVNTNQLITGRVAGVNVIANNGEPGGGAQVRIRGGTSLSASNEPLYVVDGLPLQNEAISPGGIGIGGGAALARSPLNSINPDDIESVTVLKDASATAIYGSRGANGVVLITTKRGAVNNAVVEYDGFVGAGTRSNTLDFLSGGEYRSLVASLRSASDTTLRAGLPTLGNADTDWQDAISRTALTQNHNVAFSGGSQNTQYRASLNYLDQNGVVISNGLERYQGRLNGQTSVLNGRLRLGLNLTTARVNNDYLAFENTGGFEGGVFANVGNFNPTQPVFNANGSFYELGQGAQSVRNPVALARQIRDQDGQNRTLGNVTASFDLIPNLTAQTNVGVDRSDVVRQIYFPLSSPIGQLTQGRAQQNQRSLNNLNFQQLLTYTPRILGDNSTVEVQGGYEYTSFDNSGFVVDATGFATDAFSFNALSAAAQQFNPPASYRQQSRLVSFFGRVNYGFRNKYFLQGVLRQDGSTRLAPGNQWQTFPGVSASWRISEEGFMKGSPFSTLALRAGYGLQGNQAVAPYATQALVAADNGARYPFGGTVSTGFVPTRNPNPNLKWETSAQTNVGIDYALLEGRLNGLVDVYQKNTRDLLLEIAVAQPAFVGTRFENVGSIRNRGVEATINFDAITGSERSLTTGLILAVERNQITSLGGQQFIATGGVSGQGLSGRQSQRLIPGQPIGTFFGPRFLGVNSAGLETFACNRTGAGCVNGVTTSPTTDDERIIGNANPDFSLGFTSQARFRRFDFNWLWRAEVGRDVFNNTATVYSTKANVYQSRNLLRAAVTDGVNARANAQFSSRWIESGSFLRLQNAQLGYNFRLPGFAGRGAQTKIYVAGDNLLLFTPYSGYDPEVVTESGLASRGIDYLAYPRARTITTGARVQF